MLAIACDARIMVGSKAKIGLNEIGFGSSVFAGSVEMLRFCVGERRAQEILYAGSLYSADEAFRGIKLLLRKPVIDEMLAREAESIHEFVEIWYSEETRRRLQEIKIRA